MTPTDTDPGVPPPPGPPPPPPPQRDPTRRRLTRRTDDKVVGGVASGLAAYLDVDPVLVRIGFVGLTFLGGAGIPIYLIAWLLMPADDGQPTPGARATTSSQSPAFWVGIGLLVLAAFAVSDQLDILDRSVLWPLLLIGVGVALWRSSQDRPPVAATHDPADPTQGGPARPEDSPMPTPPSTSTSLAPTATSYVATDTAHRGGGGTGGGEAPTTWAPPPVPGRDRERSILGRVTAGVALLALGVGASLDRLDVLTFTVADALALALIVVGAGLVVGTWFGRSRALIAAGIVLLPFVIGSGVLSAADISTAGGAGERTYVVSSVADLRDRYQLGLGEMTLDLSELTVDGPVEVAATMGAGELMVLVPDDVTVAVDADVSAGELDLLGQVRDEGVSLSRSFVDDRSGSDRLELDLQLGLGVIRLQRVDTTEDGA